MGRIGIFCGCALGFFFASACGSSQPSPETSSAKPIRRTISHPAPREKVVIEVDAKRAGHSLMVEVTGVGRGHNENGAMEDSGLWKVSASYGESPLRQVLAGPAKVSRAPTGKALGNQWDVEVKFLVGFALPDRAGSVDIYVQEPGGETKTHVIKVKAPDQRLSLSE